MTHNYIGTKEVVAWEAPKLIEGEFKPGYSVKYPDGYISWCPKDTFERAYRVTEGRNQALNFGDAIHFLKIGFRVARKSWKGEGWLLRVPPTKIVVGEKPDANGQRTELVSKTESFIALALDNLGLRYATWVPSQADMEAEDWALLE